MFTLSVAPISSSPSRAFPSRVPSLRMAPDILSGFMPADDVPSEGCPVTSFSRESRRLPSIFSSCSSERDGCLTCVPEPFPSPPLASFGALFFCSWLKKRLMMSNILCAALKASAQVLGYGRMTSLTS